MIRRQRGFTLVEVVVAITLLSLLLVGVYTVAVGTMKAKRRIDQSAAIYTAGPAILDLVERDFRSAYFYGVKDMKALKAQRESVSGTECTILDLVTTVRSRNAVEVEDREVRADVTEIGYRLRGSDDNPGCLELYRREQFFFDDDLLRGGDYYLVYDRVKSFTVDFFEQEEQEGSVTSSIAQEEGKETWDTVDAKAMPRAARITLELPAPPELSGDPEAEAKIYKFVRWVLFPTADDRAPKEDAEGNGKGGDGKGGKGGN